MAGIKPDGRDHSEVWKDDRGSPLKCASSKEHFNLGKSATKWKKKRKSFEHFVSILGFLTNLSSISPVRMVCSIFVKTSRILDSCKLENSTSKWKLSLPPSLPSLHFALNVIIFARHTMRITFSCWMSSKLRSVIALVALDQLFLILPKLGSICFP